MNQPTPPLYTSMFHCLMKSATEEGILSLWSGFWPNYARMGPNIVLSLMVMERMRVWFG